MPFREPNLSLRDISEAIDMIDDFISGMDFEAFREDPKTIAALERKLLVISEAAGRLGENAVALCPDQPWYKIRATGNWLRHAYERINIETVWGTIQDDLPPLKAAVVRALTPPSARPEGPSPP